MTYALAMIGCGNMARAIAQAAIRCHVLEPEQIIGSEPDDDRRRTIGQLGVAVTTDNAEAIAQADQVMLAVKPQMLDAVAGDLSQIDAAGQVVISILAGVGTARISEVAGQPLRVIRVMPNTPVMVGLGMTGLALGEHCQPGDDELTTKLFAAAGKVVRVQEQAIDAITAVSGSGPAYLFYLARAMVQAATELGLEDHADLLVRQTLAGAAQLLSDSPMSPTELCQMVASPGGTTEAALSHLDTHEVDQTWAQAIHRAQQRSVELGR